jgi:hypothetical protein
MNILTGPMLKLNNADPVNPERTRRKRRAFRNEI